MGFVSNYLLDSSNGTYDRHLSISTCTAGSVPLAHPKGPFSYLCPVPANVNSILTIAGLLSSHPTSGSSASPCDPSKLCPESNQVSPPLQLPPWLRPPGLSAGSWQWPSDSSPHLCPRPSSAYSPQSSQSYPGSVDEGDQSWCLHPFTCRLQSPSKRSSLDAVHLSRCFSTAQNEF